MGYVDKETKAEWQRAYRQEKALTKRGLPGSSDLADVLQTLTSVQRFYILLLLSGYPQGEAIKLAHSRSVAIQQEGDIDPNFKLIKEEILNNQSKYRSEVLNVWGKMAQYLAMAVLYNLLQDGLEWHKLDTENKKYVMRAIELVQSHQGFQGKVSRSRFSSIDELILRRSKE